MNINKVKIYIALSLCVSPLYLFAEDEMRAPKDFYSKDYVNESGEGKRSNTIRNSNDNIKKSISKIGEDQLRDLEDKKGEIEKELRNAIKKSGRKDDDQNMEDNEQEDTEDENLALSESTGLKIKGVGAILNSLDHDHFMQKIGELSDLVIKYDWDVKTVYAIGDHKALMGGQERFIPLIARGGVIHNVVRVPDRYNVSISPTWILVTDKGEILLEGTGPISKHLNQKGEFVDNELKLKAVPM